MRVKIILMLRNLIFTCEDFDQDKAYAKILRTVPKHLSPVAGTQRVDRHWRSLKEFIGSSFPRKKKRKTRTHDQPTDYFSHEPVVVQKAHFGELLQRAIHAVVEDLEKVINQMMTSQFDDGSRLMTHK